MFWWVCDDIIRVASLHEMRFGFIGGVLWIGGLRFDDDVHAWRWRWRRTSECEGVKKMIDWGWLTASVEKDGSDGECLSSSSVLCTASTWLMEDPTWTPFNSFHSIYCCGRMPSYVMLLDCQLDYIFKYNFRKLTLLINNGTTSYIES